MGSLRSPIGYYHFLEIFFFFFHSGSAMEIRVSFTEKIAYGDFLKKTQFVLVVITI